MRFRMTGCWLLAAVVTLAGAWAVSARQPGKKGGGKPGKDKDDGRVVSPNPSMVELSKLYEAHKHIGIGAEMPYRLLRPLNYTTTAEYPIVVCLHGVPGRGTDNELQLGASYPAGTLARPEMRKQYSCFVLAPQSPTWWGNLPYGAPDDSKAKHFPAITMLIETIEEVAGAFRTDRNRVYVTGHAMGGFGAFNALRHAPDLFAAGVIVSGGGDPNWAEEFAHIPVWIFGGQKSPILRYPKAMAKAISEAGGQPLLTILEDAPTACQAKVYDHKAVWDWLFSKRRVLRIPPATQPTTFPTTRPKPTTRPVIIREYP